MSSKQELVGKIVGLLVAGVGTRLYGPNSATVTAQDRAFLESSTAVFLENKLRELQNEALTPIRAEVESNLREVKTKLAQAEAERAWTNFFFRHPEIVDHEGNRKLLFNYALTLSDDGVVTVKHLDEAVALPSLQRRKAKQPLTAANVRHDEETLQKYCRAARLHPNTAALSRLREEFGAGFSSAEIDQALRSGSINLGPASEEELAAWAQEAQVARQGYLMNHATPQELKQAARSESEQRRVAAQQQHVQQQIETREKAEAALAFLALPETTQDGLKIDRAYLLKLADTDIKKYRQYCSRYGFSQITTRLNGR